MAMTDKERKVKALQTSIRSLMAKALKIELSIKDKQKGLDKLKAEIIKQKELQRQLQLEIDNGNR